jgi:hypothetical protein
VVKRVLIALIENIYKTLGVVHRATVSEIRGAVMGFFNSKGVFCMEIGFCLVLRIFLFWF